MRNRKFCIILLCIVRSAFGQIEILILSYHPIQLFQCNLTKHNAFSYKYWFICRERESHESFSEFLFHIYMIILDNWCSAFSYVIMSQTWYFVELIRCFQNSPVTLFNVTLITGITEIKFRNQLAPIKTNMRRDPARLGCYASLCRSTVAFHQPWTRRVSTQVFPLHELLMTPDSEWRTYASSAFYSPPTSEAKIQCRRDLPFPEQSRTLKLCCRLHLQKNVINWAARVDGDATI